MMMFLSVRLSTTSLLNSYLAEGAAVAVAHRVVVGSDVAYKRMQQFIARDWDVGLSLRLIGATHVFTVFTLRLFAAHYRTRSKFRCRLAYNDSRK